MLRRSDHGGSFLPALAKRNFGRIGQSGFQGQNSAHRGIQTRHRDFAASDGIKQGLVRGRKVLRHKDHIDSGQEGGFRRIPGGHPAGDSLHIHGIGDDQPGITDFLSQNVRDDGGRKAGWPSRAGIQRRINHVRHHDEIGTSQHGGPEG